MSRLFSVCWAPLALLGAATASSGCAPLTFSNEASIDFERYPSVVVELAGPDGSQRQRSYLESELREHSGFASVSASSGLRADRASAQLLVELTLDSSYDIGDDVDVSYAASVHYRLYAEGTLLDSGADSAEDESSSFSAAEAALDLVVLHYLRPYRL